MSARPLETPTFRVLPSGRTPAAGKLTEHVPAGHGQQLIALADQGAVSAGNFFTNVLLARSLPVDQYGIFALFVDAILFLNSLQAAILIYPLMVRSAVMDERELRRCAGTCVLLTLILAIPLGAAVVIYGIFIHAASVAIWVVLGQTLWQCQETLRRTLLARRNYRRALLGDMVSYLGQVAILGVLVMGHQANLPRAFMTMAITSLTAAVIQGVQIKIMPAGPGAVLRMGRSFWSIGRWVMTANLTTLITSVCCTYTLARWHGNADMGRFAALANLLKIANPIFITLSTLIVPAIAIVAAEGQSARTLAAAVRISRHYALRGAAVLAPYWLLLALFPDNAVALLYRHRQEFLGMGLELRLFVCISILNLIIAVIGAMFNGLRRSRRAMTAQLIGAGACLLLTIPLTMRFGLIGLLSGTLASNAATALALILLYLQLNQKKAAPVDQIPARASERSKLPGRWHAIPAAAEA